MKRFLTIAIAILGLIGGAAKAEGSKKNPPNVIYIFTDDQRFDTIRALGNSNIITPNLDKLAERSFVFNNAYCFGGNVAAVCIPARNMNMTGNSFFHFNGGKEDWRRQPRDKGMGATFPKTMKAAGYETFNREKSGSANLPHIRTQFDYYGDIDMAAQQKTGYAARSTVNDSIDYLKNVRDKSKPFFMYLGLPCPHDPRLSAQEFQDLYDRETIPLPENYLPAHPWDIGDNTMMARDEMLEAWPRTKEAIKEHIFDYYALITCMDADIGRLLDTVDALGLRDDTIIVFSSDQGLAIGSQGLMGKQSLYDDVLKVPMMFSGPGIRKGESDALIYIHDVFPTVCDLVGAEVPTGIDGLSFAPVIGGREETVRDHLMFAYSTTQRAIRDERWKLIQYPEINRTQLFDLKEDPWETTNLATDPKQKNRVEEMFALLKEEQKAYGDDQALTTEDPKDAAFILPTPDNIEALKKAKRDARAERDKKKGKGKADEAKSSPRETKTASEAGQETMLENFTVAPGLEAKLWAGSDLLHSPLALAVDAKGRVWATEDLQHSGDETVHARIKILEDTNHDGRADSAKVFGPTFKSKPLGISVFDNVIVVSMAPKIHVYTDVNRDDVFDPGVDSEVILADGFHGATHDHALHQVMPGPSGKWYVNHGNIGADITMPDGREFHASSYYSQNPQSIGKKSFDGRLYVGGFGLRMNPDGSNAEVIFQNTRNAHAMLVTSFGDILQADNDDPAHSRAAWVMEHSNFGYAALEDGNRSWEDSAKSWEKKTVTEEVKANAYERHSKAVLRRDEGHWREHFPGVTPPGNVWGPGAPTGDYMIEGDELGAEFRGRYLVCESVHRAVFSFRPELRDAQIEMMDLKKDFFATDRAAKNKSAAAFLPTDVAGATDGALFVSDWNANTNARKSGNGEGAIFRIGKEGQAISLPEIDFNTTEGLLEALRSPAPGVRWVAQDRLKKQKDVYAAVAAFFQANQANPYYQARAVFLLAQLNDERGTADVKALLKSDDAQWRITAFRALRFSESEPLLPLVESLADDPSPAVRREVLAVMREMEFEKIREPLQKLITGYDGKNRWYLEALGAVFDEHRDEVYEQIIKPQQPDPADWDEREQNLAWRLRSSAALADLADCILAQEPDSATFRKLAYTYGLCYTDKERRQNLEIMKRFQAHEAFQEADYQQTITEFLEKDISDPDPKELTQSYLFPTQFGVTTEMGSIEEIAALEPNLDNGRAKAALCMMCHQIGSNGVPFGPNLTNWGQVRDLNSVVKALVDPSAELAHGYDKPVVVTQNGHRLEGVSRGYSWHSGAIRVKTMGGVTLKVPFRKPKATIEYPENHSWMPSAANMGLNSQDVRDISAYLMGDIAGEIDSGLTAELKPEFSRGVGPGWIELTGEDFFNVNGWPDTWSWKEGHAFCNGKPTGVIAYRNPLTNFEFSCDWMHKKHGGNSGVFVWASPKSINAAMQAGKGLVQGIEVQVLDLGYREVYEKQFAKKGDWFTSHGDVFTVGPVAMKPFPPVGPRGRRSFPSKETTKGINQWNHYYVRAIDGVVRLWVNGEEVSGGENIDPAKGYLCLESEGAPVEFKNLRLRVLPPFKTEMEVALDTPPTPEEAEARAKPGTDAKKTPKENPKAMKRTIRLDKGHALLGTWRYRDTYTREFTEDGRCILQNGEEVIWDKPVTAVTPNSATVEGKFSHVFEGDVLKVEGRYEARRE